jgi:hypothetical protein
MIENLTEYKYVITCRINTQDYGMTFTEKATCDNLDLMEEIRASLANMDKKIASHFEE